MSVEPTELQVPVATSTATGVLHTPDLKTSTILPSHPLDPLSPDEVTFLSELCQTPVLMFRTWLGAQIVAVSLAVRHHLVAHTPVKAVRFITNYLLPPPKRAVLAHLGIPLATCETVKDQDCVPIVRKAEVDVSRAPYNSLMLAGTGVLHVRNHQSRFWSNVRVARPLGPTSPRDYFTERKYNGGVARGLVAPC